MSITNLKLEKFTAFEKLNLDLSPGINIFIGANGTGKTHLLKILYASGEITKSKLNFADKLLRVFMPFNKSLGRLAKRSKGSYRASVEVTRKDHKIRVSFSNHAEGIGNATITGAKDWMADPTDCVYIPVKEMLSNAPGFISMYRSHEIHFEEVYADIIERANRPALRGPMDTVRKRLLTLLQREAIEGKVTSKHEAFFLKNKQGNLEFPLLAEGIRKLGLLWLLIQNGTLQNGSILFWDEPETNLNPKLFGILADILIELQRLGVQIFIATHDYVMLKEFDLKVKPSDKIIFYSLYRVEKSQQIAASSSANYLGIHPNAIAEAFDNLYDREISRSLGKSPIK